MRLDGFTPPAALPARAPKPAAPIAPGVDSAAPPTKPSASQSAIPERVTASRSAEGEYLPARQAAVQPVHGYANQALASYHTMASLPDADVDGVFGVDIFV